MTDVDLEARVRRALAARARTVTAQDLRPVVSERRGGRVRWWLPLSAGLAAVAVVMLIFVAVRRPDDRARPGRPIAPAASVSASTPTPAVSGGATPRPSPDATTARPIASPPATAPGVTSTVPGGTDALPSASAMVPGTTAAVPSAAGTVLPVVPHRVQDASRP